MTYAGLVAMLAALGMVDSESDIRNNLARGNYSGVSSKNA